MPLKTVGEFTASLWLTRVLLTYHFTYLEQMSKVPLTPSQTTSAVIFCLNRNVWQGGMSLALRCIMSDQESVILPHRNIQSSTGTLRFQLFSDVLYNFVLIPQLVAFWISNLSLLIFISFLSFLMFLRFGSVVRTERCQCTWVSDRSLFSMFVSHDFLVAKY